MKTLAEKQQEYARLVLTEGLALQRGQLLAISCPVDQAPFARLCASAAYELGCREVVMNWSDDLLGREKFLHAADEVFDAVHSWTVDFYEKVSAEGGAWMASSALRSPRVRRWKISAAGRPTTSFPGASAPFRQRPGR